MRGNAVLADAEHGVSAVEAFKRVAAGARLSSVARRVNISEIANESSWVVLLTRILVFMSITSSQRSVSAMAFRGAAPPIPLPIIQRFMRFG